MESMILAIAEVLSGSKGLQNCGWVIVGTSCWVNTWGEFRLMEDDLWKLVDIT